MYSFEAACGCLLCFSEDHFECMSMSPMLLDRYQHHAGRDEIQESRHAPAISCLVRLGLVRIAHNLGQVWDSNGDTCGIHVRSLILHEHCC